MKRADADSQIVSPYLHSSQSPTCGDLMSRLGTAGAARVRSGDCAVLFDALEHRIVIVSQTDCEVLTRLRREPGEIGTYARTCPTEFARLQRARLFVNEHDVARRHALKCIEIEINRHCNYRCSFCPVQTAPKPKEFMLPGVYATVLHRVKEYGAKSVSLNHFSEPTIDRDLIGRIEAAAELGLSVRLFTNASNFTEEKIRRLAELGNTSAVVNLPTVDREEYARVTGAKLFDRVLANIELLHRYGIAVELSVNAPEDSADETVRNINRKLAGWFGEAARWSTDDRGGLLQAPQYAAPTQHAGRLSGCIIALNDLSVNHEGRAFLCCQDFDQRYVVGDLLTQSIREIVEGERAVAIRRMILGLDDPEPDLICTNCAWTRSLHEDPARLSFWAEGKFSSRAQAEFVRRGSLVWANGDQHAEYEVGLP